MLSPYQRNLVDELQATGVTAEKLVPNLMNKTRYVLHYRNLQLYTELGLKITETHRILRFQQAPWMQPYIEKNTQLRKKASTDFEKDLYKLMNNAVS